MQTREDHLRAAIALARQNVEAGGRPFGAVLVKDGAVVATGVNAIHASGDPTAHAELQAIRAACRELGTVRLDGCALYASGQPCPMCLSAMYLTGITEVAFAYSNEEGEAVGLSTADIYADLAKPMGERKLHCEHVPVRPNGTDLYTLWDVRQSS